MRYLETGGMLILAFNLYLFTEIWYVIMILPFIYGLYASDNMKQVLVTSLSMSFLLWFIFPLYFTLGESSIIANLLAVDAAGLGSRFVLPVIAFLFGSVAAVISGMAGLFIGRNLKEKSAEKA